MKTFAALMTILMAVAACEATDRATHPNAAEKCHKMGLAVGSAEYNDCFEKMKIVEDDIQS